jgi:hypothetical protein
MLTIQPPTSAFFTGPASDRNLRPLPNGSDHAK